MPKWIANPYGGGSYVDDKTNRYHGGPQDGDHVTYGDVGKVHVGGSGPGGSAAPGETGGGGGVNPFEWFAGQTQPFEDALAANNAAFLNADFANVDLDEGGIDEARNYFRTSMGADDPRFANYQKAQFGVLGANETANIAQSSDFFARRGAGDTTANLNATNKIRGGYDRERQALSGSLGLQQMGRQDTAANQVATLTDLLNKTRLSETGFNNQSLQSELDAKKIGLDNLLAVPGMNAGLVAALMSGDPEALKQLQKLLAQSAAAA